MTADNLVTVEADPHAGHLWAAIGLERDEVSQGVGFAQLAGTRVEYWHQSINPGTWDRLAAGSAIGAVGVALTSLLGGIRNGRSGQKALRVILTRHTE